MATRKHKALVEKILQDPSKEIGKAMKEVGFSQNTRPHDVTNTKGWKELMNEYLPDDKLFEKHEQALEAKKWNDFTGEREPDQPVILRAVELGYKLKKYLSPENQVNVLNTGDIGVKIVVKDDDNV